MRLAVLLIVALCCSPALGADLDTLHRQVAASANDIFPIHLHTLVLLPAAVVKRVGKVHLGQLDLEGPVHQVDAISAFVQEYSNLGGVNGNLDVLVSDSHSKNMVKQRAMSFVSRGMTDVGDHDRRGPGDSTAEVETYSYFPTGTSRTALATTSSDSPLRRTRKVMRSAMPAPFTK